MKVKESEKFGLKLNIQTTKIMASGPITSWQIDGETVETVADFIWGGSKITADGDCSHEIKRRLLLGRKAMTNLLLLLLLLLLSRFNHVWLFVSPWTAAHQAPLSMGFSRQEYWSGVPSPSPMDVRVGPKRKLSSEELMLLNCGVGEESWESLGLQGDQTS